MSDMTRYPHPALLAVRSRPHGVLGLGSGDAGHGEGYRMLSGRSGSRAVGRGGGSIEQILVEEVVVRSGWGGG